MVAHMALKYGRRSHSYVLCCIAKLGRTLITSKSCDIPKNVVVEAWNHVKDKKGKDLKTICINLESYEFWQLFSAVSEVVGTRRLGVPTVDDKVAQAFVKICLEL